MCIINLVIGFEVMKSNILLLTKHQMTPQMTQFLFAVLRGPAPKKRPMFSG